MNIIDAITRIISNDILFQEFIRNKKIVATKMDISQDELELFLGISADDIKVQKTILINKRIKNIQKKLPYTYCNIATDKQTRKIFVDFANNIWPSAKQAELEKQDSWLFIEWLSKDHKLRKYINSTERNLISFKLTKKKFAVYYVSDFYLNNKKIKALQIIANIGAIKFEKFIFCTLSKVV